jgi:hypothetical protein
MTECCICFGVDSETKQYCKCCKDFNICLKCFDKISNDDLNFKDNSINYKYKCPYCRTDNNIDVELNETDKLLLPKRITKAIENTNYKKLYEEELELRYNFEKALRRLQAEVKPMKDRDIILSRLEQKIKDFIKNDLEIYENAHPRRKSLPVDFFYKLSSLFC